MLRFCGGLYGVFLPCHAQRTHGKVWGCALFAVWLQGGDASLHTLRNAPRKEGGLRADLTSYIYTIESAFPSAPYIFFRDKKLSIFQLNSYYTSISIEFFTLSGILDKNWPQIGVFPLPPPVLASIFIARRVHSGFPLLVRRFIEYVYTP